MLMIDFHSHIIPGIDDGAKSEEEALKLLNLAAASGTTKIVATPHFFLGSYEEDFEAVKRKVQGLKTLVKENNIPIEIFSGQEVFYTKYILKQYGQGILGTINDTRYMLIELSLHAFDTEEVLNDLYELQLKGIVPILAHPERYRNFLKDPEAINPFIEEGFLFQLNTTSIDGTFGKEVKALADRYTENNIYSLIGSDAHNFHMRNTDMSKGLSILQKKNPSLLRTIQEASSKILINDEIYFEGLKIIKKKSFFNVFKK